MWWLIGLLAALAAANSSTGRNAVVSSSAGSSGPSACTLTYRSRDGSSFFRFRFTPIGGDFRIHILEFPNPHVGSCHILHDSRGPYICWSQAIRSMREAEAVAAIWAEATLVYQRTGRTF
jgi:hypothetical protein